MAGKQRDESLKRNPWRKFAEWKAGGGGEMLQYDNRRKPQQSKLHRRPKGPEWSGDGLAHSAGWSTTASEATRNGDQREQDVPTYPGANVRLDR